MLTILSVTLITAGLIFHLSAKRQQGMEQKTKFVSQQLKKLKSTEQNAKQIQTVMGDKRKELEAFNEKIPETQEFGEFLDQLDRMMKQRDLALISVQPQAEIEEKTLTKIPVQMIFSGSFINIFNMIHALETTGRTMVMEKIAMSKSGLNEKCRVELLASIFSR